LFSSVLVSASACSANELSVEHALCVGLPSRNDLQKYIHISSRQKLIIYLLYLAFFHNRPNMSHLEPNKKVFYDIMQIKILLKRVFFLLF
jgi:hypothetical protein